MDRQEKSDEWKIIIYSFPCIVSCHLPKMAALYLLLQLGFLLFLLLLWWLWLGLPKLCWIRVDICQKLFLHLLRWWFLFFSLLMCCIILLCIYWRIIASLVLIPLDHGIWYFKCIIEFLLLVSCCIFLCLCSLVILACIFLFFCDSFVWLWYQGNGDFIEWA